MRPPKGTYDVLPLDLSKQGYSSDAIEHVRSAFIQAAQRAGFQEITTPVLESTDLFIKSTGISSDVVGKEMYTFLDRSERSMTLRPEGTPGALRALSLAKGHEKQLYQKVYYIGPMFRYERPQQGRHRQFIQFGMELLGPKHSAMDLDLIAVASQAFKTLGLEVELQINTIGTLEERKKFRQALTDALLPVKEQLSEESQKRLVTNPLRILDSKNEQDQDLLKNVPCLEDFLGEDSLNYFEQVKTSLTACGMRFTHNPRLVRGLDYYSDTVFEWTCDTIGAQSALGGGGRYSGLYKTLGGDQSEGVGFACGIERVLLALEAKNGAYKELAGRDLLCIPVTSTVTSSLLKLIFAIRSKGYTVDLHPIPSPKKLTKALQSADSRNFRFAMIVGEKELAAGQVVIKNLKTKEQVPIALSEEKILEIINKA